MRGFVVVVALTGCLSSTPRYRPTGEPLEPDCETSPAGPILLGAAAVGAGGYLVLSEGDPASETGGLPEDSFTRLSIGFFGAVALIAAAGFAANVAECRSRHDEYGAWRAKQRPEPEPAGPPEPTTPTTPTTPPTDGGVLTTPLPQ